MVTRENSLVPRPHPKGIRRGSYVIYVDDSAKFLSNFRVHVVWKRDYCSMHYNYFRWMRSFVTNFTYSPKKCGESDQTLFLRGVVWARDYGYFVLAPASPELSHICRDRSAAALHIARARGTKDRAIAICFYDSITNDVISLFLPCVYEIKFTNSLL